MKKGGNTMEKSTNYIVVWKDSFSYSQLGDFLNTFSRTDGEEAHFNDGTVPKDGFYIQHGTITKIKQTFTDWKERYEFFSQENGGKIRKYSIPSRKKSVKEKEAEKRLKAILDSKKKV